MNIKRGFDRITIILAAISLIPAFIIGSDKYSRYKRTEIIVTPGRIWNEKAAKITIDILKDWHIEPPYSEWTAFPIFMPIAEGTIARKKNTETYLHLKKGQWVRISKRVNKRTGEVQLLQGGQWVTSQPPQPKQAKRFYPEAGEKPIKYPEGIVSTKGNQIDNLIEIDDEASLGHKEVVSITFYPSGKKCFIAGSLTAIATFPVVLFGLMGLIRLISWIIAGFK